MSRLPDFIVIGAGKAGTTALHEMLSRVPGVFVSREKELQYFSSNERYERGDHWYQAHFADARPDDVCGEVSPHYSMWPRYPNVPERIFSLVPGVRLVYVLREPVGRAYAHYLHMLRLSQRLGEKFADDPMFVSGLESFESFIDQNPWVLDASNYQLQLEKYLEYFPPEQILVMFQDELRQNAVDFVKRVIEFAGAEPPPEIPDLSRIEANVSQHHISWRIRAKMTASLRSIPILEAVRSRLPQPVKDALYRGLARTSYGRRMEERTAPPPLTDATRKRLQGHFREPDHRLSEFLGVELSDWTD
jgi:hypothetical protein